MVSIGTDIVKNSRIEELLNRYGERFLKRIYSPEEVKYCLSRKNHVQHLGGKFAGKEAVFKALFPIRGEVRFGFQDIRILNKETGEPYVILSDKIAEHFKEREIAVSISHEKEFSIAVAVVK